jgi:hypothetical protein
VERVSASHRSHYHVLYHAPRSPKAKKIWVKISFWTGFGTASLTPRWNRIFHDACVRHDYCYIYGKLTYGKTRDDCDDMLYEDAKRICLSDFPLVFQPNCFKNAEAYYGGVKLFGEQHFASDGALICQYPDRMTSREERKSIGACTAYGWRQASGGGIPAGALKGGQEPDRDLYVCRGAYEGGVHPGKLVGQACNIGYWGREISLPDYEMLISAAPSSLQWVPTSNGAVPPGAVVGGHEPGRDLYVCRAEYQGGVHPGKLVEGHACCIGWGGEEKYFGDYEVLEIVMK